MLAERLPYPSNRKVLHEALRAICEDEPTPLSAVRRVYRGDVETIVRKALEKERDRRYSSAAELAADIRRYLAHEPILARRPSAQYQLSRFARRNRGLVAGVATVFVVLVAGIAATSWQAVRTRREALKAQAVSHFLQDMLGAASPRSLTKEDPERGRNVTVVQVLGEAVRRLDAGALKNEPLVDAAVRRTIGAAYLDLGEYASADSLLRRSLETRREHLGARDPEVAENLRELGRLAYLQGRPGDAALLFRQALEIRSHRLGPRHPLMAESLNDLAEVLQETGQLGAADSLSRAALTLEARPGSDPAEHARTLHNLALLAEARGEPAEAESLYERTLEIRRQVQGADHPDVASALHSLALLELDEGRPEAAERSMREALGIWRKILGDRHPFLAASLTNLAVLLRDSGKVVEAGPLIREAVDIQRAALGRDDPQLGGTLYNLAKQLQAEGRPEEAEPLIREALAIERKAFSPDHPIVAAMTAGLGSVLTDAGRPREAEAILREAREIFRKSAPDDWQLSQVASLLGDALLAQGRYEEAEPLLLAGYEGLRADPAVPRDRKQMALARIVRLYDTWSSVRADRTRLAQQAAWRDTLTAFKQ